MSECVSEYPAWPGLRLRLARKLTPGAAAGCGTFRGLRASNSGIASPANMEHARMYFRSTTSPLLSSDNGKRVPFSFPLPCPPPLGSTPRHAVPPSHSRVPRPHPRKGILPCLALPGGLALASSRLASHLSVVRVRAVPGVHPASLSHTHSLSLALASGLCEVPSTT